MPWSSSALKAYGRSWVRCGIDPGHDSYEKCVSFRSPSGVFETNSDMENETKRNETKRISETANRSCQGSGQMETIPFNSHPARDYRGRRGRA